MESSDREDHDVNWIVELLSPVSLNVDSSLQVITIQALNVDDLLAIIMINL